MTLATRRARRPCSCSCDTTEALAKQIDALRSNVARDKDAFDELYAFVFDFAREPGQKNIEVGMASGLLSLLLPGRFDLLDQFTAFLEARILLPHRLLLLRAHTWLTAARGCVHGRHARTPLTRTRGS